MMEGSLFSEEEADELSLHSKEVIRILTRNEEQFTENKNGYMFDVSRLKESTVLDLKNLTQKPAPNFKHGGNDQSTSDDYFSTHRAHSAQMTKYSDVIANKTVSVSPKFLSEYNNDFQKLTAKPASMLKFLNAKKKYLRNFDNTPCTKIDLKRESF